MRLLPLGACLAAIAYLALKPSPDARTIPFLPGRWARWLDYHDKFNNVTAFLVLAAVVHWTLSGWKRESASVLFRRVLWMEAMVISLELAQLWLPRRSCDWHDMLSGLIGIGVATVPWLRWKEPPGDGRHFAES